MLTQQVSVMPAFTLGDMIDNFKKFLNDAGRASLTVKAYTGDVRHFGQWFMQRNGQALSPDLLTPTDIREYRAHLLDAKAGAATINRRLIALRVYTEFALAQEVIDVDPTKGIKFVERQPLAPKWLTKSQQFDLLKQTERELNAAKGEIKKRQAIRDMGIVQVLMNTGLRVNELCALTLDDVTMGERSGALRVRKGKGTKQRTVSLNNAARAALRAWLDVRLAAAHEQLFTDSRGDPLQARGVQHRIGELGRLAKLEITPHTLRHTFAKNLVDGGVSLEKISALLGHSSLNTTRIYTTPSAWDLEQAVNTLCD